MDPLIYLPSYGSGLGHVSRVSVIASELQTKGYLVRFSSFGEGARYLKEHRFECDVCPAIDVGWADGKPSAVKTLLNLPSMMLGFLKQVRFETKNMKALKPKVVVNDSRLSSVIAASNLKIPCITMLNQVRIALPEGKLRKVAGFGEQQGAELFGRIWSRSDKILVPDLPPPHTICAKNVWDIDAVAGKLDYVGFIVRKKDFDEDDLSKLKARFEINGSKRTFFAQISGPDGTREDAIKKVIEASKQAGGGITFIVSGGNPRGSTEPVKIGNSWYFEWCPIRDELFALADYAIIRGGHSTIAQSVSYGKPMVVLPIENHPEQIGNGKKVSELGLGLCIDSRLKTESLLEAADEISSNDKYTSKAQEVAGIAEKRNGPENAVNAILSSINQ